MTQLAVEGKKQSRQELKAYQADFCASCKSDKKAFVTDIAEKMEEASIAGDLKELNKQKQRLSRGKGGNKGKPTMDANGNKFSNTEDLLKWWHSGMEDHWKKTEEEDARPQLEELVRAAREKKIDLSDGRLDRCLWRLKEERATGDDEVPVELYEAVQEARLDLYAIVRRLILGEDIPDRLVVVLFIMIYKGAKKGSMDAFGSYRPIGLLMHAFKLVDVVFLEELVEDTELFLSPAHEGYRANRGARGNILRARLYTTLTLELGMVGVMTLLDYTGAFDATARSFTDLVLGKSGSRRKLRSLHRKMAAAATDRVRTQGLDGAEAETEPFKMTRGGIQGLGSTAYLFILCLSEILEEDDALNNDLDYAIRRECLRIETLEREEAEGGVVHEQWLAPVTKQWTREPVVGSAAGNIGSVTSTRPTPHHIAEPPP